MVRYTYWVESSYDFEDMKKERNEELVIGVDMGEKGTQTVATFSDMSLKEELEKLLEFINTQGGLIKIV